MTRADYIRWAAALLLPHCPAAGEPGRLDLDRAVNWAEALDARLAERGYPAADGGAPARCAPGGGPAVAGAPGGAAEAGVPRARGRPRKDGSLSAYERLSEQQRAAFDLVRTAYRLAADREGAAATWAVLAPDAETAARILAAAIADAAQATPDGRAYRSGQARPYLMRWLRDRRWEETPAAADGRPRLPPAEAQRRVQCLRLQTEIAGLARQIEYHERDGRPVPEVLRRDLAAAREQLAEMQAAGRAEGG